MKWNYQLKDGAGSNVNTFNNVNMSLSGTRLGIANGFITNDHDIRMNASNAGMFRVQQFTMSVWFAPTANLDDATDHCLIDVDGQRAGISIGTTTALASGEVGAVWNDGGVRGLVAKTLSASDIGVPHLIHFAFDSTANEQRLFLNGRLVASSTLSANISYNSSNRMGIGRDATNATANCDCWLKDFRFYNFAFQESHARRQWEPSTRWELYRSNRPRLYSVPAPVGGVTTSPAIMLGM